MKKKRELTYMVRKRSLRGEDRWVAGLRLQERRTFQSVCTKLSKQSSAQPGEVSGVLRSFLEQIRFHVLNGESVTIEGFGTFYPKLTTKMVATAEEATVRNCVKSATIGFRPTRTMLRMVQEASLKEFVPSKNNYNKRKD